MKKCLFLLLVSMTALLSAGCNTLKGAGEGFTKDWAKMVELDQHLQRIAW